MTIRKTLLIICLLAVSKQTSAQDKQQTNKSEVTADDTDDSTIDDLMDIIGSETKPVKDYISSTFKATRIINGSSVENIGRGVLDFRIQHRFGKLSEGTENFFGLDNATTRIGLDYGVSKNVMIGLGHNTLNKTNDGFLKVKILAQRKKGMPVTVSYFAAMGIVGGESQSVPAGKEFLFTGRISYAHQLLVARKFNDRISIQFMPALVHMNLVDSSQYANNTLATGLGGRIKMNKRIALTGEYFYRISNSDITINGISTHNSLSIGIDIETGGHVFQLMISNASGMTERTFIANTTDKWTKGELHFGFNISRVFTVVKPKEFRK